MRIVCAIGARRGVELIQRIAPIARPSDELVLVHIIDTGPRHDLNHLGGTLRPHHFQREELNAAEEDSGRAMLEESVGEARRLGLNSTTRLERGRPEQVLVSMAKELGAQMIVLLAHENPRAHPLQGPPSVGHTARFIIDHALADVMVLRERP